MKGNLVSQIVPPLENKCAQFLPCSGPQPQGFLRAFRFWVSASAFVWGVSYCDQPHQCLDDLTSGDRHWAIVSAAKPWASSFGWPSRTLTVNWGNL